MSKEKQCCGNCRFWKREQSTGECRVFPPEIVVLRESNGTDTWNAEFPLTNELTWCGSWEAK